MQAFVDEADAALVVGRRWILQRGHAYCNCQHPTRRRWRPGKGSDRRNVRIAMHRVVLGIEFGRSGVKVNHIDGDTLNNRRANLRILHPAANVGGDR